MIEVSNDLFLSQMLFKNDKEQIKVKCSSLSRFPTRVKSIFKLRGVFSAFNVPGLRPACRNDLFKKKQMTLFAFPFTRMSDEVFNGTLYFQLIFQIRRNRKPFHIMYREVFFSRKKRALNLLTYICRFALRYISN